MADDDGCALHPKTETSSIMSSQTDARNFVSLPWFAEYACIVRFEGAEDAIGAFLRIHDDERLFSIPIPFTRTLYEGAWACETMRDGLRLSGMKDDPTGIALVDVDVVEGPSTRPASRSRPIKARFHVSGCRSILVEAWYRFEG